tara:strand:- start:29 stop:352 length:324 start_codon:yes stop_codon:yes gene_type:complete
MGENPQPEAKELKPLEELTQAIIDAKDLIIEHHKNQEMSSREARMGGPMIVSGGQSSVQKCIENACAEPENQQMVAKLEEYRHLRPVQELLVEFYDIYEGLKPEEKD